MEYLEFPDGTSFLHVIKNRNTIWDVNHVPKLYQVEIIEENDECLAKNIDDILHINGIYCNICKLNIPKKHLKDHNMSAIHQNLLKLTDEVLERTRKHLKTNEYLTNTCINVTDTFFCDLCSKIVENNNKMNHLESKNHKKFEIFEKLLSFFVEAYLNDGDIQCEMKDIDEYIDSKNKLDSITQLPERFANTLEATVSKDPDITKISMDPREKSHLESISEANKGGNSMNHNNIRPKSNPINPNFHPLNPNFTSLNPNQMNPNLNSLNPNFNFFPNCNQGNLNWNPSNSNWNPNNLNWHPNFPVNPHCNPMNPNFNPLNPNFNPTIPNWHPTNPNFYPMNPNFNQMNSNLSSSNSIPMKPNFNSNPQFTLGSNLNIMGPQANSNPMDPQFKPDSNLNIIGPQSIQNFNNIKSIDPQLKHGSNLIETDHQSKLNLNTMEPQLKLDSNLIAMESQSNLNSMDPQSKLDSNFPMDSKSKISIPTDPKKSDPKSPNSLESTTIDPQTKKIIKKMEKAERKREKQIKNLRKFKEFDKYLKNIQEQYFTPGFKIEAVTISNIRITALNGDCILVSAENFHSINKKYCRVCQNGNLRPDHDISEDHISKIMVPVADKHCIREIDDIWSHCILCNELIKYVEDHAQTEPHLTNLKKCHINIDGNNSKDINNQDIFNEDNTDLIIRKEVTRDSEEKNWISVQNAKERKKDTKKRDNIKLYSDIDENSLSNYDDEVFLLALKMNSIVSNTIDTLKSSKVNKENKRHIANKDVNITEKMYDTSSSNDTKTTPTIVKPNEKYKTTLNPTKNTIKYCSVCRLYVEDFETHKTTENHIENHNRVRELGKITTRNNMIRTKESGGLKCDLCNENVNYNAEDILEHVYSQNHRKNYFKYIETNKIILINETESQCEACNTHIHRCNIFNHCKKEKHFRNLTELLKKPKTTPTQNKKTIQIDVDITKIMYIFQDQVANYLCKTCRTVVPKDIEALKEHIASKKHIDRYENILHMNKIIKNNDSFYCEKCDCQIPMMGELIHINRGIHLNNILLKRLDKKDESNEVKKTIDIPASSTAIASTSKTELESPKTELILPLNIKYQLKKLSETESYCLICKNNIQNSELIPHFDSSHGYIFNSIMIENTIKIKDKQYICLYCNTSVPIFGEIDHIFGKRHLNNSKDETKQQLYSSKTKESLTYDYMINLPQGNRMIRF